MGVGICLLAAAAGVVISAADRPPFLEVTDRSGVGFVHVNGAAGELLLPEVIGSGGALFDYDNDGDLDLFAVQGSASAGSGLPGSKGSRLYRNDWHGSGVELHFTDVTEQSGIAVSGYGMGAAAADIDNDGWIDLYVTALGSNRMLRNNGDGTFRDVTARTHTDDPRWSTSATFFDYDRDGYLDLYVVNYVRFSADMKRRCFSAASARDYCNPAVYDPVPDTLFHNNGDGTFSDVSAAAGLTRSPARGLGALAAEFNGDGWTDVYVANDGDVNQLWINERGSGRFSDDALLAGVAVNRVGQPQGSMGVDFADVDEDGDDDLFVTNLDNESNTLYRNQGGGLFEDRTSEAGLFRIGFTGFGTKFIDYDNDGWLDLVVANGAVRHIGSQVRQGDPYPLRQRNLLFHNQRGGRFADVTDGAGAAFAPLHVGRGLATGDLDNDGDIDVVIFDNNGPARVLLNQVGSARHWLGICALDGRYHRDALQSRVTLVRSDGRAAARRVYADGSYGTASDSRIVFGLGDNAAAQQTVRVQWPDGAAEDFRGLTADRYWVLERGKPPRAK